MYIIENRRYVGDYELYQRREYYTQLEKEGKLHGSLAEAVTRYIARAKRPEIYICSPVEYFARKAVAVSLGRRTLDVLMRQFGTDVTTSDRLSPGFIWRYSSVDVRSISLIFGRRLYYMLGTYRRVIVAPPGYRWIPVKECDCSLVLYVTDGKRRALVTSDDLLIPNAGKHIPRVIKSHARLVTFANRVACVNAVKEL